MQSGAGVTGSGPLTDRTSEIFVPAALVVVHALACVLVRRLGFDHVSDDDFARVTIAQTFAIAPRPDPSGTSWLPFPFWILGTVLAVLGRSLAIARGTSIVVASLATLAPYLALRTAGVPRSRAAWAVGLAFLSPWAVWLGAATVPESLTASLSLAAVIALGGETPKPVFVLALGAACLSRYEAWPLAPVLAVAVLVRSRASASLRIAAALACIAGPLAWMAWNAYAHDGPLHFFHRVARFKQAAGEHAADPIEALLLYPRLLVLGRPDAILALSAGLATLRFDAELRRRWIVPLVAAGAQLAFLAYGNVRDGAPTHHPERALLPTAMILVAFGADAVLTWAPLFFARSRFGASVLVTALVTALALAQRPFLAAWPGTSAWDDRSVQIERGLALRGAREIVVEPCAFEHFALVAAFAAPERATIEKASGAPVDATCPHVVTP